MLVILKKYSVKTCDEFFCWNFEIWAVQKYENLVDLEKSKMLQKEYLVTIVAVDTAENEPSKNL